MSKDQFDLKLEAIEALTKEETVEPTMPVAVALQEAEDLYHWCQPDKEGLIKAGLDPCVYRGFTRANRCLPLCAERVAKGI